jgi:ribosomal protein S12 methylthiotransferase
MKTYLVTMGCPKNLVDSEAALALLAGAGCTPTDDPDDAELLIVSACSFLDAAWQETIEEAQRLGEVKARGGSHKKVVMMGCLPKHRALDLEADLPFVDHFLPAGAQGQLPDLIRSWRHRVPLASPPDFSRFAGFESRALLTPSHTAYVKIAEGCSRRCSFCAIPKIRGRMISRPVDSVVREVQNLLTAGVKEVSLLAQDITSYNDGGRRFPDLVDAIAETGIPWIRIFYVHPGSLTLDLARRWFAHASVCRYLEAPVQHASDRILRRMRRPYTRARVENLFRVIRQEFPDVRIRSEVIVGFPGESDDDFDELKRFVETIGFSSLGVFTYSPESNTPAAAMEGAVPESVKSERAAELSSIQEAMAFGLNCAESNRRHKVLVDRKLDDADDGYHLAGRHYGQALEVDGEVLLRGGYARVGDFVNARITDPGVFDLRAEIV